MFLSHIDVSLPLSFLLSLKSINIFKNRKRKRRMSPGQVGQLVVASSIQQKVTVLLAVRAHT